MQCFACGGYGHISKECNTAQKCYNCTSTGLLRPQTNSSRWRARTHLLVLHAGAERRRAHLLQVQVSRPPPGSVPELVVPASISLWTHEYPRVPPSLEGSFECVA
jgi:hypothetical protein